MLAIGVTASSIRVTPSVTLNATTNYSHERATVNASVNALGLSTTVVFNVSSNNGSSWSGDLSASGSPVTGHSNTSVYNNATGLTTNTSYIVRVVATNVYGTSTTQTSTGNFTTWVLKTFFSSTASGQVVSVPTVTPTGGSAIQQYIYSTFLVGGGGGSSSRAGGGGGGYRSSGTIAVGTDGNVTVTAGAGGGSGAAGSSSTLARTGYSTITAGGGGAGSGETGGSVGSGDNAGYTGGGGNAYVYEFTGSYVQVIVGYNTYCCQFNVKTGQCTQECPDYNSPIYGNDPNQPIYANNYNKWSGGGGASPFGNGGAGSGTVGGNGAGGSTHAGYAYGGGGAGNGSAGAGSNGSNRTYGGGGQYGGNAGSAGFVYFQYYAP
jgi:hypothetical protein